QRDGALDRRAKTGDQGPTGRLRVRAPGGVRPMTTRRGRGEERRPRGGFSLAKDAGIVPAAALQKAASRWQLRARDTMDRWEVSTAQPCCSSVWCLDAPRREALALRRTARRP